MISTASFSTLRGARWVNVTGYLLMQNLRQKGLGPPTECVMNAQRTHWRIPWGQFYPACPPGHHGAAPHHRLSTATSRITASAMRPTSAKSWAFDGLRPQGCVVFGVCPEGLSN